MAPSHPTPPPDHSAAPQSRSRAKWALTKDSLDKLLFAFSPDRDEAGAKYELMQRKLLKFFEYNCSFMPAPDLVDEVVNRVARRLDEGEEIFNLNAYFRSVAKLVAKETFRLPDGRLVSLDLDDPVPVPDPEPEEDKEARLQCLDECLEKLAHESRNLILGYYTAESRHIDKRKQLAKSLGIGQNALRIRACRIRGALEVCVKECVASHRTSALEIESGSKHL